MTKLLTILFLLQATSSFGQIIQKNPYKDLKSVAIPDSLPLSQIKYFHRSSIDRSQSYSLESNGTYFTYYIDDALLIRKDTGVWKITNKNILLLTSPKEKCTFNIVILGEYYFFICLKEKQRFISRVKETEAALTKAKSIKMKEDMNGMSFLAGEILHEEFYVTDKK